jgi:hypothetical protein
MHGAGAAMGMGAQVTGPEFAIIHRDKSAAMLVIEGPAS